MKKIGQALLFRPVLMEKVWGGNRLGKLFGKACPPDGRIGESWEIADRSEAQSLVSGGAFDGWTLRRLMEEAPEALLGPALAARHPPRFPLLVKFVDAGRDLSVQVHPDDEGARALAIPDRGKTECWVIVHAEPGARIQRGLKPGVGREDFERARKAGRVEDVLHFFEVRAGDVIAIPPGMVHAICAGIVLAEIQQNSDVTFRVYDYNRPGMDGRPRPLHVKEALRTIRFDGNFGDYFEENMKLDTIPSANSERPEETRLLQGRYFDLRRMVLPPGSSCPAGGASRARNAPVVLMLLQGQGTVGTEGAGGAQEVRAGQSLLLPADCEVEGALMANRGSEPLVWLESTPTIEA